MSKQTDYNGWSNWETWNFMLWINNEERLYRIVQDANKQLQLNRFFIAFLKGTAKEIINTPLCLDLKPRDIENINFEEVAKAIREEVA
jgi:hypothetical protein